MAKKKINSYLSKKVSLKKIFLSLQEEMISSLSTGRKNIFHPGTKGDVTELQWIKWLEKYLPERYKVEKAFVVDVYGHISEQLDLVIFDRQYSPFLFVKNGAKYVPAESVYAILEVKQVLNKTNIEYASKKALSVKRLHRTTAKIPHAGGIYSPKKPVDILSGILTLDCVWKKNYEKQLFNALKKIPKFQRMDLGCALRNGSFLANYKKALSDIELCGKEDALIFFFVNLLIKLQIMGTVPAINIKEYSKAIKSKKISESSLK